MSLTNAHSRRLLFALAVLGLMGDIAGGGDAYAQVVAIEPRSPAPVKSSVRVDTHLVLVPVDVLDAKNQPVLGLKTEQFKVFDNKREQRAFSVSTEDAPLSIGIVFDSSGSMADKVILAREAVRQFVGNANPEDEFFMVSFNDSPQLALPFTNDADAIEVRLNATKAQGRTALLDALYLALYQMKQARNPRRMLFVISDGGDNHSRYSLSDVRRLAQESDVWVYALETRHRPRLEFAEEDTGGGRLLDAIAEPTGGRCVAVESAAELPEAAAQIAREVRNRYVLAFNPGNIVADGKYHRVEVKLVGRGDVVLFWRRGYYSPTQ